VINISNYAGKDNTLWLLAQPARTAAATGAPARTAAGGRTPGGRCGRVGRVLAAIGAVLLSWLAAIPRRLGDRLFTMNDTEACWQSWQITKTHGGLGRRYRDLRFDTLAECPKCRGSGGTADPSCPPCLGTGRVTLGEVS
jgi:hypothetical protein